MSRLRRVYGSCTGISPPTTAGTCLLRSLWGRAWPHSMAGCDVHQGLDVRFSHRPRAAAEGQPRADGVWWAGRWPVRRFSSAGEADEDDHRATEPNQVLIAQAADPVHEPRTMSSRDLVNHETAWLMHSVSLARLHAQTQQGCFRRVSREGANRHRIGGIEAIVLDYHNWARLARVSRSAGCGPYLAAPHTSLRLIASMKS